MIGRKPAGSHALVERIARIRIDAEKFVEQELQLLKKDFPNLPIGTLKQCELGNETCLCAQVIKLSERKR